MTRIFSPSQISMAQECEHKWALRYIDKIKPEQLTWEQAEADMARPYSERVYSTAQHSAALGTRTHAISEAHDLGTPLPDPHAWDSLPGQVLARMMPTFMSHSTHETPLAVEIPLLLELDGVTWRGYIDRLFPRRIQDLKTTSDIVKYALLPHFTADYHGVPERSLWRDLQACVYAVWYCVVFEEDKAPVEWSYGQTKKAKRALPVHDLIPLDRALVRVREGNAIARRLRVIQSSDEAVKNPDACDKYGKPGKLNCWYGRNGHCKPPPKPVQTDLLAGVLSEAEETPCPTWSDLVGERDECDT